MYLNHFPLFIAKGVRWQLLFLVLILAPTANAVTVESTPNMVVSDLWAEAGESIIIHGTGPLTLTGTLQAGHGGPGQDGGGIHLRIDGVLVLGDGARLVAGNGGNGSFRHGGGTVAGQAGGNGGGITVHATAVQGLLHARPGDGGDGGDALATGHSATAVGGVGGNAGTVEATGESFLSAAARGGNGGEAEARGDDACNGQAGHDDHSQTQNETTGDADHAEARGEEGACAQPGEDGGSGGNATALGGNGGYTENGPGGNGGNATAIAGRGSDALDLCYETTEAARASGLVKAGNGGNGGSSIAIGGNGGTGLNGGRGGDAYAESRGGHGGNATLPIGLGNGGGINPGGKVKAGDGGMGVINGGPGGSAVGLAFGGDGGSGCGPLPYQGTSSGSIAVLGFAMLGAVAMRRQKMK